jgi:hypothetical protein
MVIMISVLVNLVLVNAFECNKLRCPTLWLNNSLNVNLATLSVVKCDLSCNILPCHLDILTDALQEPLYKTFKSSDCYIDCLYACDVSLLKNDVCDSACNTAACGYDLGKCGYCAKDCKG